MRYFSTLWSSISDKGIIEICKARRWLWKILQKLKRNIILNIYISRPSSLCEEKTGDEEECAAVVLGGEKINVTDACVSNKWLVW